MVKDCFYTLLCLFFSLFGYAQQQLMGRIEKKGTEELLVGVNVLNLNQKKNNRSDLGGNYRIPVRNGDTLIFSSAGYLTDTVIVNPSLDFENNTVFLNEHFVNLPYVVFNEDGKYQLDSINRSNEYNFIYRRKHPVKLWNEKRQGDDPGFSFSPIGYYSSNQVRQRRLKKRLAAEEEDYYIDYKFSASRVAQLTRLKGDSLQLFMRKFRPSYLFCRKANAQDILFYVNEKLKLFSIDLQKLNQGSFLWSF